MSEAMSLLRTAPPPVRAEELASWTLTSGTDLRPLRVGLVAALAEHRLVDPAAPAEGADPVILVATELASNALRHGSPPAVVRLLRCPGEFVIDVADHDVAGAPELAHVHDSGIGGRGLHIVRTLSRDLCVYVTARTKHVWASFPTPAGG